MKMKRHKRVEIPKDLISRIAGGDEKAFEELYYLTYKPLYGFLLSLTKNKEDADDLLQETYIKVKGSSHLYKDQGNPMAWIMKIGKNLHLMNLRKNMTNDTCSFDDYSNESMLSFDNVSNIENKLFLEQIFSMISEEDRNIVIMHVSMGLKHKEIAQQMGMPVGTVLSRYHRAMKVLSSFEKNIRKEA